MSGAEEKDAEPQSLDEEEQQMSEQLRASEKSKRARRDSDPMHFSSSASSVRRRGRRGRDVGVGQLVANAWAEDEAVEDICILARDARGGGQDTVHCIMEVVAEVEREHGEIGDLEHNPQTVFGMDIGALFKYCLRKGMQAADVHDLMTVLGRISRRAQRRR